MPFWITHSFEERYHYRPKRLFINVEEAQEQTGKQGSEVARNQNAERELIEIARQAREIKKKRAQEEAEKAQRNRPASKEAKAPPVKPAATPTTPAPKEAKAPPVKPAAAPTTPAPAPAENAKPKPAAAPAPTSAPTSAPADKEAKVKPAAAPESPAPKTQKPVAEKPAPEAPKPVAKMKAKKPAPAPTLAPKAPKPVAEKPAPAAPADKKVKPNPTSAAAPESPAPKTQKPVAKMKAKKPAPTSAPKAPKPVAEKPAPAPKANPTATLAPTDTAPAPKANPTSAPTPPTPVERTPLRERLATARDTAMFEARQGDPISASWQERIFNAPVVNGLRATVNAAGLTPTQVEYLRGRGFHDNGGNFTVYANRGRQYIEGMLRDAGIQATDWKYQQFQGGHPVSPELLYNDKGVPQQEYLPAAIMYPHGADDPVVQRALEYSKKFPNQEPILPPGMSRDQFIDLQRLEDRSPLVPEKSTRTTPLTPPPGPTVPGPRRRNFAKKGIPVMPGIQPTEVPPAVSGTQHLPTETSIPAKTQIPKPTQETLGNTAPKSPSSRVGLATNLASAALLMNAMGNDPEHGGTYGAMLVGQLATGALASGASAVAETHPTLAKNLSRLSRFGGIATLAGLGAYEVGEAAKKGGFGAGVEKGLEFGADVTANMATSGLVGTALSTAANGGTLGEIAAATTPGMVGELVATSVTDEWKRQQQLETPVMPQDNDTSYNPLKDKPDARKYGTLGPISQSVYDETLTKLKTENPNLGQQLDEAQKHLASLHTPESKGLDFADSQEALSRVQKKEQLGAINEAEKIYNTLQGNADPTTQRTLLERLNKDPVLADAVKTYAASKKQDADGLAAFDEVLKRKQALATYSAELAGLSKSDPYLSEKIKQVESLGTATYEEHLKETGDALTKKSPDVLEWSKHWGKRHNADTGAEERGLVEQSRNKLLTDNLGHMGEAEAILARPEVRDSMNQAYNASQNGPDLLKEMYKKEKELTKKVEQAEQKARGYSFNPYGIYENRIIAETQLLRDELKQLQTAAPVEYGDFKQKQEWYEAYQKKKKSA